MVRIHDDLLFGVQLQAQRLSVDPGQVRFASGSHQHLLAVRGGLFAIHLVDGPQASPRLFDPQHSGAGQQADAQLFISLMTIRTASFCSRGISSGIISTTVTSVP